MLGILSSLQRLCQKAKTWGNVVTVIKLYLDSLAAQKIDNSSDCEKGFDITTCITVQVTSQVAKVMFESAVDILILLNYMVKLAGQINMLPDDVSRIKLELLPLLQKIITHWHTIYFFGTTPCESPPMEDSSSRLSLSDGWANQSSWNVKLGKCDFTLAFLLILDRQRSFQGQNGANLRHLPNPISFSAPLRKFSSWIVWGMIENGSSSSVSSTRLPLILLKYGQFDAAESTLEGTLGMAASVSSPASLLQLYVDYGRYAEATNLVLHYLESVASLRPDDVIRRNKPFAMWFPYTTIERLKCKLEELINSGQMVAEYEEQRNLIETALLKHFQLLQSDSDNVMEMPFATS